MPNNEWIYQDIGKAIVIQAAQDYRNALRGVGYDGKTSKTIIKEVEKFFHSMWFEMLTTINGEYLIEQLKKEHSEKNREDKPNE